MQGLFWASALCSFLFFLTLFKVLEKHFNIKWMVAENLIISIVTALLTCCVAALVYFTVHSNSWYLPPAFLAIAGIYLGTNIFESISMEIHLHKIPFGILIHHFVFFLIVVAVCYDGKAHLIFSLVFFQAVSTVFYHLLLFYRENNFKHDLLLCLHGIAFILFRVIGMTVLAIYYALHFKQFMTSHDYDLTVILPIMILCSLLFNYYWGYVLIEHKFRV